MHFELRALRSYWVLQPGSLIFKLLVAIALRLTAGYEIECIGGSVGLNRFRITQFATERE